MFMEATGNSFIKVGKVSKDRAIALLFIFILVLNFAFTIYTREVVSNLRQEVEVANISIVNYENVVSGLTLKTEENAVTIANLTTQNTELSSEIGTLNQLVTDKGLEITKLTSELKGYRAQANKTVSVKTPSRGSSVAMDMRVTATAYDLTPASCGKSKNHPAYGLTATGYSLKGKDHSAMVVAVDPKVIPLKSYVYVEFNDADYKSYDGWYYTADTGGAIKGNIIDVYLGEEGIEQKVSNFGRRGARITAIKR